MTTTMEDLEKRVIALEKAQSENLTAFNWVAGKLGVIESVQVQHTERLNHIDGDLLEIKGRLGRVEKKLDDHVRTFPLIVAETMREVLREQK